MPTDERQSMGLRERKKAKTMAAIQEQAMKLFREKGYHATTVEQIAEAAEVSPSTFFRYFPTKEDVVVKDYFDPYLIEAFRSQPAHLNSLQAIRAAIPAALGRLSQAELDTLYERNKLILNVPELRAATMNNVLQNAHMIVRIVAERSGRSADDLAVRTFAGAVTGAFMTVILYQAERPDTDFNELIGHVLDLLEAGLAL